jgi:hypothetical protein
MMNEDVFPESRTTPQDRAHPITLPAGIGEQQDLHASVRREAGDKLDEGLIGRNFPNERVQRLALLVENRDYRVTGTEELPNILWGADGRRQAHNLARRTGEGFEAPQQHSDLKPALGVIREVDLVKHDTSD